VIDIPKDVTAARTEFNYPSEIKMRSYNPTVKGHIGQIKRAAEMILAAERPMIYTGGGVILGNASEQLTTFTRQLGYPITNTLMGLGAYPANDMHGTYEANMGMHHCDVLIAIGARFDDRVTGNLEKFCPHAKIVHIDVDPASISKNVKVDIPIVGHVSQVLGDFIKVLGSSKKEPNASALEKWWAQIDEWRSQDCLKYDRQSEVIKPQYVIEQLHEITKGDAFVTSDVGQHQMWAAQYYGFNKPRRWINSGGLGTMGFGLPAAMGVQLAYPDETVVCITGEASIQMCIQELSTCKQYGLPVKIICLNNGYMGMVRQWQEFFYEKRYAMSYFDALPDFVALTQSYGHTGIQVANPADVRGALEQALGRKDELVFLDFLTDKTENVYPMIPAGAGLNEMILV
jgi:acetolactate synthase-1/2/3 large subunit